MKHLKFHGIDSWNRPVFKDVKTGLFYGAVDVLFDNDAREDEVLKKIWNGHITYFGTKFGCEPMGSDPGEITLVESGQLIVGDLQINCCNECPGYAWIGETPISGDMGFYCKFGSFHGEEYSQNFSIPKKCALKEKAK